MGCSVNMFTLKLDTSRVTAKLALLKQRAPIAIMRGLNKTAASEKVAMSRAVSQDMGLKVSTVKDAIAVRNASATNLSATVAAKGGKIPLIDFSARGPVPSRGRGRGVTAKLPPPGAGRYPNAFIATMRSGHKGVFERVPGGRRRGPKPNRSQLPIYELFGPSIAHVFGRYIPIGAARRNDVLIKNVTHEISFELSKLTA